MADIYEPPPDYAPLSFRGDLNPPPSAKGMGVVSTPPVSAPAPDSGARAETGALATGVQPDEKSKGVYRVVDTSDGKRKMFFFAPDGQIVDRGEVIVSTEVLNTVGTYDEQGKTWDVPEKYALSFERGKPGFAEHIANSFEGAEAGMHEGLTGYLAVTKKMPYSEALAKTEADLVKSQLANFPKLAWGDNRLQNIVAASKWALGAAAEIVPSQWGNLVSGIESAPKVALGATAVAATAGPAGLSTLATPPALMSVAGVSWQYGAFDFTSKVTTGSMALEMKRKGIDDKTIETVAPIAGMFAGALEVLHVKYLPAPFRRAAIGKILGNGMARKAMEHWVVNYFKEVGAEVSVEVAQQYIQNFGTNIMASMDKRPDINKNWDTMNAEAGAVALKTAVGLGLVKASGMVFEAVSADGGERDGVKVPSKPKNSAEAVANGVAEASTAPTENVGPKTLDAQKMNETLAAAPKAPEIEQALVAETPEVAQSLADLNAELNPASEDAFDEYAAMGEDLVGNENAQAAVVAKIEALRSEMSDIFSERENTPQEQSRVIDIQKELGLLTEMQKRMEAPAVFDEDFGEGGSIPVTEGTAPLAEAKPIAGVAKRVQDVVLKAREAKLVSELQANTDMTAELMRSRARLEKAGKSTLGVDKVLATLQAEALRIDEARRKSTTLENGVASTDKIEVTPATLASIGEAYFKEGRKDVNVRRTQLLNDVAEQYGLSDADMAGLYTVGPKGGKSYLMNRNMGLMSDYDFKRTLDAARESARILADKKQAMAELGATQEEMNLKKEANLRKFLGFPKISEMTADQMREYAGVLETFQNGDIFWSAKRIDALKNTRWAGAKTAREVLEKLAAHLGVDPEVLKGTRPNQSIIPDVALYDAPLSKQNPIYAFLVDSHNEAHFKHEGNRLVVQAEHLRLAKAALASRNRTIGRKVANWFLQTQPELMAYREETDPKRKAALGALLTEEELAQDAFYTKFMADAYEYLIINGAMMSSRYTAEGYMAHYGRPLPEIIAGIGEVGIRQTLTDIWDSFKLSETQFSTTDSATGQTLSLRKFTDRSLFRTGELKPTQNIIRAFDVYAKQLSVKKTLDDTVPSVETAVLALDTLNKDEAGKAAGRALHGVIKDILNAKKGQYIIGGSYWTKGGKLDTLVSAVTSLVSLKFIGVNYALQATMWAGEGMAAVPVIGSVGLAKAQYRMATKQGRAILKTHENFVGQGILHDLTAPGETVTEKANVLLYGLAKQTRVWGKSTILLGSMTDAEFAAGRVSDARLAEIQAKASRWMDLEGSGSAIGGHSLAKVFTQFRKWAVPIMHTTAELSAASLRSLTKLGDSEKRLNASQVLEIRRLAEAAAIAGSIWFLAGKPDDRDDSWTGKLKQYWMRDVLSPLQGLGLTKFTAVPVALKWMEQVGNAASALVTEGDIKPLGKAAPIPNAINPFKGRKKKAPTRFKFQGEK